MESIDQLSAPYRRIFLFKLTRSGQESQKVVNRFLTHFVIDFDMLLLLRLVLVNNSTRWSGVVIVVLSCCVRDRELKKAQTKVYCVAMTKFI